MSLDQLVMQRVQTCKQKRKKKRTKKGTSLERSFNKVYMIFTRGKLHFKTLHYGDKENYGIINIMIEWLT